MTKFWLDSIKEFTSTKWFFNESSPPHGKWKSFSISPPPPPQCIADSFNESCHWDSLVETGTDKRHFEGWGTDSRMELMINQQQESFAFVPSSSVSLFPAQQSDNHRVWISARQWRHQTRVNKPRWNIFELLIKMLRHGMSSICLSIAFSVHKWCKCGKKRATRSGKKNEKKLLIGTFQSLSDLLEIFSSSSSSPSSTSLFARKTKKNNIGSIKSPFHQAPWLHLRREN